MTAALRTHAALEFLVQLDSSPGATFNIEHFTDVPTGTEKHKPDPLIGRYANKTLHEVGELLLDLEAINAQGAGIFVARNQCTGLRSTENVTRIRGVHADMDGVTPDQIRTLSEVLEPSIIVESSPGRYQLYWQLSEGETLDKEEAKAINQRLARVYGADPAAVDVSRLLRLPGFRHMKYRDDGKTPTVTARYFDHTYTADGIRAAFPPQGKQIQHLPATPRIFVSDALTNGQYATQIAAIEAEVASRYKDLWQGNWPTAPRSNGTTGYPSGSEADLALAGHIARACSGAGIPNSDFSAVVETVFSNSTLGKSKKWVSRPDYRERTIHQAVSGLATVEVSNSSGGLQLDSYGDVRNAKAFADIARGRFIYITTRDRWLRWDGHRWLLCEKDEHLAQAKEVCAKILDTAARILSQNQGRGKRLIQDAVTAHSLPRIMAMLKLAVSEEGMAATDRELDSDPYMLGVENGVVDLRRGHHLFNQPELFITRYCDASYDEDAKCDRWLQFLDQIFEGDIETIESVQLLLGCSLLGLAGEEILVICYGHGSNGKSVFSNTVHKILGSYAVTAPPSLLAARKANDSSPRNDIAALAGTRYVSINEMQAGDRLDEQVVKSLAGREPISARFLHQEFFEFLPSFTPWLRTNHKPIVTGEDDGIWRRLVLLRFGRTFSDAEKDPDLEDKLLAERDGILLWMIDGARTYLREGLCLSPRMKSEWATYRTESDLLGEFLSDKTVPNPSAKTNQSSLYADYRAWCEGCGVRALSKKSFTQRLAERGYPEGKSGANRFYIGLALAALASSSQGGMDGILSDLGKSSYRNSNQENYPNSPKSCPPCPTDTQQEAQCETD
jgi:putative DNA primase/helicase